jgi:hypothetical protein
MHYRECRVLHRVRTVLVPHPEMKSGMPHAELSCPEHTLHPRWRHASGEASLQQPDF